MTRRTLALSAMAALVLAAATAGATTYTLHTKITGEGGAGVVVTYYVIDLATGTVHFEVLAPGISKKNDGKNWEYDVELDADPTAADPSLVWAVRVDARKATDEVKVKKLQYSVDGKVKVKAKLHGLNVRGTVEQFWLGYEEEEDGEE